MVPCTLSPGFLFKTCIFVLFYVYVCFARMHIKCMPGNKQKPEQSDRSPGTGVTDSFEPACGARTQPQILYNSSQ